MKKQMLRIGAALLVCGAMMMSSCSKDEDIVEAAKQDQPVMANPYTTFANVVNEVNQNLQQCDFAELKPLAIALENNTAVVTKGFKGDNSQVQTAFISRLTEWVKSFFPVYDEENPFTYAGTYTNSKETLRLGWELSSYFTSKENYFDITEDGTLNVEIVVNDTTTYNIALSNLAVESIDRSESAIESWSTKSIAVNKGNEAVARIFIYGSVGYNYGAKAPFYAFSGTINYQTHYIDIEAGNGNNGAITINLEYANNGKTMITSDVVVVPTGSLINANANISYNVNLMEGMAVINGVVNDVREVAQLLPTVVKLFANGDTKENCDAFATAINEKHNVHVSLAGSDMGTMYMGSELVKDSETTYRPALILEFAMFDNEPMTINEVLEAMGMSLDDIIGQFNRRRT